MSTINPIQTFTIINGVSYVTREEFYENGIYHRLNGPAFREFKIINGISYVIYEKFYNNGKLHRLDGPAIRHFTIIDEISYVNFEKFYNNGKLHRLNGPAYQYFEIIDGVSYVILEEFYENGKLHRDGFLPAFNNKYYKGNREYSLETLKHNARIIYNFMLRYVKKYRNDRKEAFIRSIINSPAYFPQIQQLVFSYI